MHFSKPDNISNYVCANIDCKGTVKLNETGENLHVINKSAFCYR